MVVGGAESPFRGVGGQQRRKSVYFPLNFVSTGMALHPPLLSSPPCPVAMPYMPPSSSGLLTFLVRSLIKTFV